MPPGARKMACVQVYGTKGSLFLSDPDNYGEGSRVHVLLEADLRDEQGKISWDKTSRSGEFKKDVPLVFECPAENRGLGLCEMIEAIKEGRPARANGEFACHVTEMLDEAILPLLLASHIKCRRPSISRNVCGGFYWKKCGNC